MDCRLKSVPLVCWNVRGLGHPDKCAVVRDSLTAASPHIVCLQESKLQLLDNIKAHSFLPATNDAFAYAPADGSSGGIITAWNSGSFSLASSVTHPYSLTTTLHSTQDDSIITITNVYAPADHRDTPLFLDEINTLLPSITGPWLLLGDFNLTRDISDKNNNNFNPSLATSFNNTIDNLALLELPLLDRLFTWSNGREHPTLARLDRAFINNDFSSAYPNTTLTSLPRQTSDHVPLLVSISTSIPKPSTFRFENSWLKHTSFLITILPTWSGTAALTNAAGTLVSRLKATRYAAKVWARKHRSPPSIYTTANSLLTSLTSSRSCVLLVARSAAFVCSAGNDSPSTFLNVLRTGNNAASSVLSRRAMPTRNSSMPTHQLASG